MSAKMKIVQAPLALLPLFLVDVVTRRRLALCRAACFLTLFFSIASLSLLGVLGLWLAHLVPRRDRRERFLRHNAWLQTRFCTVLYRLLERIYAMRTHCPTPLPTPGEAGIGESDWRQP